MESLEGLGSVGLPCCSCKTPLTLPYIDCKGCPDDNNIHICLQCFSRGAEFGSHKNNHPYSVVSYNFPVFEQNWSAAEEYTLLENMEHRPYGNWIDASFHLDDKTPAECERHYNKCYINNPKPPLPKFPEYEPEFHPTPYTFVLSENPPRPAEGSVLSREMAGYNAARGDFAVEYNNFAELDICNMTFDEEDDDDEDTALMHDLKFTMLESYRYALKERQRRKKIIRDYGLINIRRTQLHQSNSSLQLQLNSLKVFSSLMTPLENDMLHAGFKCVSEEENRIVELQEYRRNGLTRRRNIPIYKNLRTRRNEYKNSKPHHFTDVLAHIRDDELNQNWLKRHTAAGGTLGIKTHPALSRKPAARLEIEGLPGYERLTPAERELCETARLTPKAYLEFSAILINENYKNGGLRLAQARTLIKIDVNKTRKLFDFLVQEKKISKS